MEQTKKSLVDNIADCFFFLWYFVVIQEKTPTLRLPPTNGTAGGAWIHLRDVSVQD